MEEYHFMKVLSLGHWCQVALRKTCTVLYCRKTSTTVYLRQVIADFYVVGRFVSRSDSFLIQVSNTCVFGAIVMIKTGLTILDFNS